MFDEPIHNGRQVHSQGCDTQLTAESERCLFICAMTAAAVFADSQQIASVFDLQTCFGPFPAREMPRKAHETNASLLAAAQ